jgi:hypothetical protein
LWEEGILVSREGCAGKRIKGIL